MSTPQPQPLPGQDKCLIDTCPVCPGKRSGTKRDMSRFVPVCPVLSYGVFAYLIPIVGCLALEAPAAGGYFTHSGLSVRRIGGRETWGMV
jgi:hypothetical protein